MQKLSSFVFGSLYPLSMTVIIITRLRGAELRDWMKSHTGLRRAIIGGEPSIPSLIEFVKIIVSVRPLIVVYLKKTGKSTNGDILVVEFIFYLGSTCNYVHMLIVLLCFRRKGSMAIFTLIIWRGSNFACSTWCSESVSPASCTFPPPTQIGRYTFRIITGEF